MLLPEIQSYKAPGSDREVQLRLYNHVYRFTATVGTQTEDEVFYMNGKPARAVHPFRIVPKKPREVVAQMAELEMALAGPVYPVYNEPVAASVQYLTAMPPTPLVETQYEEQLQYQEVAYQQPEPTQQPEIPEVSAVVMRERHSQETQTETGFFLEDEGADTASVSEDSNTE